MNSMSVRRLISPHLTKLAVALSIIACVLAPAAFAQEKAAPTIDVAQKLAGFDEFMAKTA